MVTSTSSRKDTLPPGTRCSWRRAVGAVDRAADSRVPEYYGGATPLPVDLDADGVVEIGMATSDWAARWVAPAAFTSASTTRMARSITTRHDLYHADHDDRLRGQLLSYVG